MGRWRDRRGYGQLRLPVDRGRRRRASWLDQDLRARRAELVRTRWVELVKILGAFAVTDLALVLGAHGHPVLQAAAVGAYLGAMGVFMAVFLSLADGSLLARLGRMVEDDVGDELRATTGLFGVVSALSFERVDVDHVVLAPTGAYAIEVKTLFGRRETLQATYGLPEKVEQARRGARKVQLLLASGGCPLPVRPVLVLAGPGCPSLDGAVDLDGVLVMAFRDSATWRGDMARPAPTLNLNTARSAARHLLAYQARRTEHQLPAQRRRHPAPTARASSDHPTSTPPR